MKIPPHELARILGANIYEVCRENEIRYLYVSRECCGKLKALAKSKGIKISCMPSGAPPGFVVIVLKKT